MRGPLNLATRPFQNQTLPRLGKAAVMALLVGLTLWHALVVRSLVRSGASDSWAAMQRMRQNRERLGAYVTRQKSEKASARNTKELAVLKELVDQRTFGWSDVLGRIEAALPAGVRIVAITPSVRAGVVRIGLEAIVASAEQGFSFVGELGKRPNFANVLLKGSADDQSGTRCQIEFDYVPPEGSGVPRATAARGPGRR